MKTVVLAAAFALAALPAPAQPTRFYVPKPVDLPGATAAEGRAHALWNLRAAVNVGALQCQFSPFLRLVPRYNALIKQHSAELGAAYAMLQKYFTRRGKAGMADFDRYLTRVNQSYATLDAQIAFCGAVADAAYVVVSQPIGKLAPVAAPQLAAVRASFEPPIEPTPLSLAALDVPEQLPTVACRRGRC